MSTDAAYKNLTAAIAADRFPTSVIAQAQVLRDALISPARITLLGLPGVGKTGVLNLLAGARVVPDLTPLGTIRVEHGPHDRTEITLADGSTAALDGLPDPARLNGNQPMLTRIQTPLPALTKINLMELNLGDDPVGQSRAINWAAKQTDIAIWCTNIFSEAEEALWLTTPDRMRDHGILLQTKMDQMSGNRAEAVAALHDIAGSEFAYALGVSVFEANAAAAHGGIDKQMMRASGGMKLISTILSEIETGRQNMVDQADVLLRMHPEKTPAKVPEKTIAPVQVAVEPAPEASPQRDAADKKMPDTVVIAFDQAVQRLSQVGHELGGQDAPDTDTILDASIAALDWLCDHLDQADLPDTPAVARAQAMTQDADDLVQLMRIEGTQTGRTDAILALLQLKRELQTTLAA